MSEDKYLENEEIQKGLEAFLDHEMGVDQTLDIPITSTRKTVEPVGYVKKEVSGDEKVVVRTAERKIERSPSRKPQKKKVKRNEEYLFYDEAFDDYDDDEDDVDLYDEYEEDEDDDEDEYDTYSSRNRRNKKSSSNKKKKSNNKANKNAKNKKAMSKKKGKKGKKNEEKKKHGFRNFLIFIGVLILIFMGVLYSFVGKVYDKMNYVKSEGMKYAPLKEDGVINVLLIGNDSRLGADDGRSDAMILVSISDKTKTITMTSFLRDMYVEIPGHDGNRLNAAYAYGGPELLMETIEQNFDIKVHRYCLVNFEAFANLVDAVGGINLDVTNEEVQLINGYLMEYNQLLGRDLTYDWLDENASGNLHLNGAQALAYTRNRYIGTDFGRTERQRKVLSEVFKKLPTAMIKNGNGVIDGLFPNLTTNLTQNECFRLSLSGWKLMGYEMEQSCVPLKGTYTDATIRSMMVLQVDFEKNIQYLKWAIYGIGDKPEWLEE